MFSFKVLLIQKKHSLKIEKIFVFIKLQFFFICLFLKARFEEKNKEYECFAIYTSFNILINKERTNFFSE